MTVCRATRVEAAARLHLGFLDPDASRGRRFGSIGLAIDGFSTVVQVAPDHGLSVTGSGAARARTYVDRLVAHYNLPLAFKVSIERAIPAHAGLGSGTQLALALGTAILAAHGRQASAREVAAVLDRGKRSGIGLGLFERGGLIVDGGHGPATAMPPVIAQLPVPLSWRAVLVLDRSDEGLNGRAESAAFAALPRMSTAAAAGLCHVTLMALLPAIVESDFAAFSHAIAEVQAVIGDHFARVQAGRFTSASVRSAIAHATANCGLVGVGQSSWGPTAFVWVESAAHAQALVEQLRAVYGHLPQLEFVICGARNHGASLSHDEQATPRRAIRA